MRVDGKFMIGHDIPEGQASVNNLLAECFDMAYELRNAAEDAEPDPWRKTPAGDGLVNYYRITSALQRGVRSYSLVLSTFYRVSGWLRRDKGPLPVRMQYHT